MQAMMFLDHPVLAEGWRRGKRYMPGDVKSKSPSAAVLYDALYDRLSEVAHPRVAAIALHTVAIPEYESGSEMLFYGGWFAPKSAGILACEFARVMQHFIRDFYQHYRDELASLNLLFTPGSLETIKESGMTPDQVAAHWEFFIDLPAKLIEEAEQYFAKLPSDQEEMRSWVASPEHRLIEP